MKKKKMTAQQYWSIVFVCLAVFVGGMSSTAAAITVYFTDGTTLEVDEIARMGDTVYLTIDLSRIDTSRTPIQDVASPQKPAVRQSGLSIENFEITPSEDQTELTISGEVSNNAEFPVTAVKVSVTLQDKQGQKLLTVLGAVRPEKLAVGETGSFSLQVRRPENFWKASADIQATSVLE